MASVHGINQKPAKAQGLEIMPSSSSWISAFEYDAANMRLTTHLKSGAIYQHSFVMPSEWEALKTAQSHSKHWADAIRGKKIGVRVKVAKSPTANLKHKPVKFGRNHG